jgi:hypothetical protein
MHIRSSCCDRSTGDVFVRVFEVQTDFKLKLCQPFANRGVVIRRVGLVSRCRGQPVTDLSICKNAMQLSEPSILCSRSAMAVKYRVNGLLDASAQRPWNCFIRPNAGTPQQCRCIKGSEAAQLSEQQLGYESTSRRAALIAVGFTPFLAGVYPVWADPSSEDETASSVAGEAAGSATEEADSNQSHSVSEQQQEQTAPPNGSQQGPSLSDSVEQADRDDSPVGSIEDEGSSGSDSDSSSDSDSESSSDDEPGRCMVQGPAVPWLAVCSGGRYRW